MPYLGTGTTVAAAGSSGAGKSTLLNWLSGTDRMRVQEIREHDARGKHTTTHRELFPVAGGTLLMDTPGMRELQLWHADEGHEEAFGDIAALAARCRYRDCKHDREEGCAVRELCEDGQRACASCAQGTARAT
jgi:ribosome biogenesis GTPase